MSLDLDDCTLAGSALTAPFLRDGLGRVIPIPDLDKGRWDTLRAKFRTGGADRVHRSVTSTLGAALGYGGPSRQQPVRTRDGDEDGGWLLNARNGLRLRVWSLASDDDLDAAGQASRAYRSSPTRVAQRVLRACGERAGLITNGETLRLLLCDSAHADSHISVGVDQWRHLTVPPDSIRVVMALAGASGLRQLPEALEAARLHQARVTAELRRQAREAIVGFINALPARLNLDPVVLWQEGLVLVYRLLFILKLENPAEAGGGFSFASTRLWRDSLSPNRALGGLVRRHLDRGHDTGQMLETGLRSLFTMFQDGLVSSELRIAPLGGALFGTDTMPLLNSLEWGERAVATLLDRLIWIATVRGERARVHYGSLDVEDLGSIYEGLLDQEPGIATEPSVRVRHGKQEVVRAALGAPAEIQPGQFFLRSGTGRKATGSFYTPHEFVRFLVREALDPKLAVLSPPGDPHPARLLGLKIVDPSTGSGHFLVEACRYLGDAVLSACVRCDELGLHDRIAALSERDDTIAAYLPSRGFSEARARAVCRRLVAVHCLYGCDRNKLAVELAKLSLWLESYAEGLPLTFLDHRLAHGDALTGPFFASLSTLPVTGGAVDPLLAREVLDRLDANLSLVRLLVTELDGSIGRDIEDLTAKEIAKRRLDQLLHPLRQLARAWSGAAMSRDRDADDVWLGIATHVATTGSWPRDLTPRQAALLAAGADALPWDLAFPEVFPAGFTVVLGNPPWDVVLPNTKDFVAGIDPSVLDARTRADRAVVERAVLARPGVAAAFDAYREGFDRLKRIASRLYRHQRVRVASETTAGNLDLFRLFAERNMNLAADDGAIGVLMPSAFHSNEGTTGVRRLYLHKSNISWCLSFENRRRIFDIDSRFKFDLIVAHLPGPTRSLRCGFYLGGIEDVADPAKIMDYSTDFLTLAGGPNLSPLELRSNADLRIAETLFAQPERLGKWCANRYIRFGNDLHMTADARHFQRAGAADLVMHEGKTFHQYTDTRETSPRYSVARDATKPAVAKAAQHYRLAFRDIARSNDERTMIAFVAPPGVVFGHTATVEKSPGGRDIADALVLCALFNSFPFDWLTRQKAATHLSLYLLEAVPVPVLTEPASRFLAHAALRLSCTGPAYTGLLQMVGQDTDLTPLTDLDARWMLRAEIDAVVAKSYGLKRPQYEHLLGSFSHRSYSAGAALCLQAYDGLSGE